MRVLHRRCVAAATVAATLILLVAACGGNSDADDPARTEEPDTAAAVPTTPPPDSDYVFAHAILNSSELPTEWDAVTGPDSETLQLYGPELCSKIGAERWSAAVFFRGLPTDTQSPQVTQRVYEYRPGDAETVIQNLRDCVASGTLQPITLIDLGDGAVAAQTNSLDPEGRSVFITAGMVRHGDFITLVLFSKFDDPAAPSQLELFARKADEKLERALIEAPARRD